MLLPHFSDPHTLISAEPGVEMHTAPDSSALVFSSCSEYALLVFS